MDDAKVALLEAGYMVMSITNIQITGGTVSQRERVMSSISHFPGLRYLSNIQESVRSIVLEYRK